MVILPACSCCTPPPPPPENCFCPDLCSYFIEVTEPEEVAVKSAHLDCSNPESSYRSSIADPSASPFTAYGDFSFCSIYPLNTSYRSSAVHNYYVSYLEAEYSFGADLCRDGVAVGYASVSCTARVSCANPGAWTLRVYTSARVESYLPGSGLNTTMWLISRETPVIILQSECISDSERVCVPPTEETDGHWHLQTPLTFTATGSDSGFGEYEQTTSNDGYGPESSEAEAFANQLLDQLSVTFSVTNKPSCEPRPCEESCVQWCEQIGTLTDPEDPCPPGYAGSNGWCRKLTQKADCDRCDEPSLPAPPGLTDYEVNCIGYCCDIDSTEAVNEVCYPTPCCTCSDDCTVTDPASDNSGLDEHGQGVSRSGFVSGSPPAVAWARGYPDRIGLCYFWWRSDISCTVVVQAGTPFTPQISAGNSATRYTLYGCVDGEFVDITSIATTNGPFITRADTGGIGAESAFGGFPCPTEVALNFLDPTIECNPLP
jgi:hypothetical protein